MVLRLGPLKIPWLGRNRRNNDPYWDFFINTPPADLANTVIQMIREAPEGNVFPTKADIHTPEITSNHVKEMARYFGADLVGIAGVGLNQSRFPFPSLPKPARGKQETADLVEVSSDLPSPASGRGQGAGVSEYPFAVICVVRADYDPRQAPGIGSQVPVQNGLFITFVLSAWIRELGFRATAKQLLNGDALAAAAGLGKLDQNGRLVTPQFGSGVHVADVILTDLPLAADG